MRPKQCDQSNSQIIFYHKFALDISCMIWQSNFTVATLYALLFMTLYPCWSVADITPICYIFITIYWWIILMDKRHNSPFTGWTLSAREALYGFQFPAAGYFVLFIVDKSNSTKLYWSLGPWQFRWTIILVYITALSDYADIFKT